MRKPRVPLVPAPGLSAFKGATFKDLSKGGPVWNPEAVGDSRTGRVVKIETVKTKHGDTDILRLEDADGLPFGMWLTANLESYRDDFKPGRIVRLTFDGTRKTKRKRTVKVFRVEASE